VKESKEIPKVLRAKIRSV